MGDELKILLALQIQALGQEALAAIAGGLDSIGASGKAAALAVVPLAAGLAGIAAGAAVLGEAVKQAADFQTTMTQVANNTNMSDQAMAQMSATVLDMAKTTSAPIQQLADGYMHVTNMGFQGAQATEVLNAAMESAVSTGGDVAATANVLANVMHEFAMNGNQAGQAMDVLHTAAALGNMTLEQMTNSFGPVAAIASTVGVPLNEAAAAMAAVTRHGFDAAEAGTQVKNMIERLVIPTPTAVKELQALSQVTGVDLVDAQKKFAAGTLDLTGYLADLSKATNGNFQAFSQLMGGAQLTQQQMDALTAATHGNIAALQKLDPNIRGLYGLFILTGRGAGDYADILKQVNASMEGAGITAESFARTQQTVGFQLGVLKNNLQVAAITLGQEFLPAITSAVTWITGTALPVLGQLASDIGDVLGPKLAALGTAIQGVFAAFQSGGLLGALQQMLSDIGSFADSMFGAGWNLVVSFGSGIMQAAQTVITEAVNYISSLISSFLVGQSPPPEGPLSEITTGGSNLMAAYADGIRQGAGDVRTATQAVASSISQIAQSPDLSAVTAKFQAAEGSLKAMKQDAADAKQALADLQPAIDANKDATATINLQVKEITDQYNAQIDPLQQQLDALKQAVDYTTQIQDANDQLTIAQDNQRILADQGDPAKRAALEAQLQSLQAQQQGLDIQSQIANLEAQKKQAAGNPEKLAALNVQLQELQVKQQLYDLQNHADIATTTADKQKVTDTEAVRKAQQAVLDAQTKQKELGLEKQISAIKAEEQGRLQPLKDQLTTLQSQAQTLNEQKQAWTELGAQISAAAGKLAALGGGPAPKLPKGGGPPLPPAPAGPTAGDIKAAIDQQMQTAIAEAQSKAEEAARKWVAGFEAGIRGQVGGIQASIGGVFSQVTTSVGNIIKQLQPVLAPFIQVLQTQLVPAFQALGLSLKTELEPSLTNMATFIRTMVLPQLLDLADVFTSTILPAAGKVAAFFVGTVVPAVLTISNIIETNVLPALSDLAVWFDTTVLPAVTQAADEIGQFVDVVLPKIQAVLQNLIIPGISQLMADLSAMWQQSWGSISEFLTGVWDVIKGVVEVAWALVSGIITTGLDLLSGNWSGAWQDIQNTVKGVWVGIQDIIKGSVEAFVGAVGTVMDAILSALKGVEPQWAQVGFGLVDSLKQAILDKAGELAQAAIKLVQDAVNGAKHALGMSSPSKVFQDIGTNMALGLVQGLADAQPVVTIAGATLAGAAVGGALTPPAPGSGRAGVVVNINNPTLLNARDMRALAEQVSRAVAGQVSFAYSTAR